MVATWKKDIVSELSRQVKSHSVVAVVGISGIPSKQIQVIRKRLKGQTGIAVSRSNLIKRALDKAGVKGMDDYVEGPTGLLFSDLNPFKLEKLVYGCKTNAPVRPGTPAPFDLIVPEGDTGLPAGPLIGDLQAAGVKARIQGGKIIVSEKSVIAKAGERVDEKRAAVLARLGIEPLEIVLRIKAAHEGGVIYGGDILHIDETETVGRIAGAYQRALNLAYNAKVYNKAVVRLLVQEAAAKARNLMVNARIINRDTIGTYLAKADAQAKALKAVLPEELKAEAG